MTAPHVDANTFLLAVVGVMQVVKGYLESRRGRKVEKTLAGQNTVMADQNAKLDKAEVTQDKVLTLSNGGMAAALTATLVALQSDAASKQELAQFTKKRAHVTAARAAEKAVRQQEDLLRAHIQRNALTKETR